MRRTPASASCSMRSRSVFGGTYPCVGGKTLQLRLGQPLVVGLVAQRHRYGVDLLEEGRHHVDGKLAAQRLRDLAMRQLDTLLESVIGDDFDDALLDLECRHGGLSDLWQVEQHRFDFVELDAIAADLDLRVDPAAVVYLAVLDDSTKIAGAIDSAGWIVLDMQEIADELLHRQVIAIYVTKRQSDARDTDLAYLAGRNGLVLVRIEDDDRIGRERYADRDRLVRPQLGHCRRDGRLGGAVGVENAAAGAVPLGHEILRASLAADQQDPQVRHVLLDSREQRRTTSHHGHTAFAQKVSELVAHQGPASRARHERRAGTSAAPRSPRRRNRTRSSCPDRRDRRVHMP